MLLRLLILVVLIAAVAWVLTRRARMGGGGRAGGAAGQGGNVRPLVQDPVCKTFVPKETAIVVRKGERDYYFCGRECAERFEHGDTER